MPRSEFVGPARVCGEPQFELALRLAGQVQHHDAVGGAIVERDRTPEHAAAIAVRRERALHPGERLVFVGVSSTWVPATSDSAAFGRRISNSTAGFWALEAG